jgi:hypothetical protein
MTSPTQTPTLSARPEYMVSVRSVKSADGSELVKATYAGCSDEMLPLLSHEEASEVLRVPLGDISSAMELPRGVTYVTINSPIYANMKLEATRAGKRLLQSHRKSHILTAHRVIRLENRLF